MVYAGRVLRELVRARIAESKVCVWSRSLDPIGSIDWPLLITGGPILPGEEIE